jgi:hypothetical protein
MKFYFPHDNTVYFIKPVDLLAHINKYQAIVLVSYIEDRRKKMLEENIKMSLHLPH